ncbi:MAG: signal recognition particle-docking protein FtsY [Deltaproteobacteria bacterium]|nr:MAG: signal recognition particle-docking protein FtsY [Deltaproteobacteria bacterium]
MEQLDLNNPTTLAAIAAIAALIVLGIIIGFVRGRRKRELPQEPPPPPPEALAEERPKIRVEAEPEAEPTQPLQLEDLVPGAPAPEARVTPPPAPADLGAFRSGLKSTRGNLISRLAGVFRSGRELDKSILDEVEEVLITADVGVHSTERVLEALRTQMNGGQLESADDAWDAIRGEAKSILASSGQGLAIDQQPTVILVVGVNGVGKTTTIGKLASRFGRQDKTLLLAAGDTFRAAAVTQLEVWGRRVGCEVVKGKDRADPGSVIFDAIQKAKDTGVDIVIADTAGRLHTKVPLMDELKKVGRTVEKALGRPADHVLLVLDATTGQNAIQQAQLFKEALPLSGIVLTKLDGTAKGGVILGIVDQHQVPIEFIGIGEKVEDLKPFDAETFLQALFEAPETLEPAEEALSAS